MLHDVTHDARMDVNIDYCYLHTEALNEQAIKVFRWKTNEATL